MGNDWALFSGSINLPVFLDLEFEMRLRGNPPLASDLKLLILLAWPAYIALLRRARQQPTPSDGGTVYAQLP